MAAVTGVLRMPRRAALVTIAAVITATSLTSFAESYRGLYDWARQHGLSGLWAAAWPLQLDTFIAVGELAPFVALADRWAVRSRIGAWAVTLLGLAASVAGNVGHVHSHLLTDRTTAAVPPLAAAAALAVGLGVLKRVVGAHPHIAPGPVPQRVPGPIPGNAPVLNGRAHPNASRARTRTQTRSAPVTGEDAEREFGAELASGALPSLRTIRTRLHVGQDRARGLREHLESLTRP